MTEARAEDDILTDLGNIVIHDFKLTMDSDPTEKDYTKCLFGARDYINSLSITSEQRTGLYRLIQSGNMRKTSDYINLITSNQPLIKRLTTRFNLKRKLKRSSELFSILLDYKNKIKFPPSRDIEMNYHTSWWMAIFSPSQGEGFLYSLDHIDADDIEASEKMNE